VSDARRPTVILSTYNQPRWLEKSLWGYAAQTHRDFQLVVADDGSGPETAALVERLRGELGLDLVHVWHEDRGFRKTVILNRAILAARSEYLIFSDGDCIPRADFVATHVRYARPAQFLSGTYIHLSLALSEALTRDDVASGRFSSVRWLRTHGFRQWRKVPRLLRAPVVAPLIGVVGDLTTTVPARFDGNNVSAWKEEIVAVNGFDMDMQWGLEDRSLGMRLRHNGVRGRQLRNRAIVFHLEHGRPYVTPEMVARNKAIAARIETHREVRAPRGLAELQAELATGEEVAP
jgi:glycosyltransferase involved in cell wall biosynthesis